MQYEKREPPVSKLLQFQRLNTPEQAARLDEKYPQQNDQAYGILVMGGNQSCPKGLEHPNQEAPYDHADRVAQTTEIGPYSHFVLPGDKVQPLGPVNVKTSGRTSWHTLTLPTSEDEMKLFNLALNEYPEAGVVIDYVRTNTVYHLGILPIYWNELELEGVAAKVVP